MPGTFDKQTAMVAALANYSSKAVDWLQSNLTQDELTALETAMIPPLTPEETAQEIYNIGNSVKKIGIDAFAQVTGIPVASLETALATGTAAADAIMSGQ